MADNLFRATQDFHRFAQAYREQFPDDVLTIKQPLAADQDVTAIVAELAARGRHDMLICENVDGIATPLVTNFFASRARIGRLFDVDASGLFDAYQQRANAPIAPVYVPTGPILDQVIEGDAVDLAQLPMIRHFDTDRGPYITNAVIIAEDPVTGVANLSYHRSMRHARNALATSLHSRGHLWRMLQTAKARGDTLKVAMVIGAHPLFMLAAAARVPFGTDERTIAGGLFGAPLELVRTPRYGIGVPASAEFVLEGTIDPDAHAEEGPFGEFTGYSSDRSTNNVLRVDTMMRRNDAWLVDVVGGPYAEHLTLARLPREAEMSEKLKARFPSVTALHYPNSGTHFHCYVALNQTRDGEALGWDPYLKNVVAVDSDIDITNDSQVLWAIATHFQPHQDVFIVDGLPGSPLDPSSSAAGTTSRMGIDATRGSHFDGIRAKISERAAQHAVEILARAAAGAQK
jgi:2,5-furandicarboxylate decarboxylase 1